MLIRPEWHRDGPQKDRYHSQPRTASVYVSAVRESTSKANRLPLGEVQTLMQVPSRKKPTSMDQILVNPRFHVWPGT